MLFLSDYPKCISNANFRFDDQDGGMSLYFKDSRRRKPLKYRFWLRQLFPYQMLPKEKNFISEIFNGTLILPSIWRMSGTYRLIGNAINETIVIGPLDVQWLGNNYLKAILSGHKLTFEEYFWRSYVSNSQKIANLHKC